MQVLAEKPISEAKGEKGESANLQVFSSLLDSRKCYCRCSSNFKVSDLNC